VGDGRIETRHSRDDDTFQSLFVYGHLYRSVRWCEAIRVAPMNIGLDCRIKPRVLLHSVNGAESLEQVDKDDNDKTMPTRVKSKLRAMKASLIQLPSVRHSNVKRKYDEVHSQADKDCAGVIYLPAKQFRTRTVRLRILIHPCYTHYGGEWGFLHLEVEY